MRTEHGKLPGGTVIRDSLELHGMIAGDARVSCGGALGLYGTVAGDLVVEDGATAMIHGTVAGDLVNRGTVEIAGVVAGELRGTGTSVVRPGAVVSGRAS